MENTTMIVGRFSTEKGVFVQNRLSRKIGCDSEHSVDRKCVTTLVRPIGSTSVAPLDPMKRGLKRSSDYAGRPKDVSCTT